MSAENFVAEIRANVDEWYSQPNTPETNAAFRAKNGATWNRIIAAGQATKEAVERILAEVQA